MHTSAPLRAGVAARERALGAESRAFAVVVVALLAAWSVGLFARGIWTPDEPREADVAWRMSLQPDHAVPSFAGTPIVEKPPLTYWLAGASIATFGNSPWAARVPNLLYALLTVAAVALLARTLFGASAELPAAVLAGSFALSYQVAIWLATDAPLVAAVAVALLGAALGATAEERGPRLRGYLLMHAGLAFAFLAKGPAGWLVPVVALATTLALERRWREFARSELWIGAVLPVGACVAWTLAVDAAPGGAALLKVAYWYNLVGRAVTVAAPAAADYSSHRNWFGKYLVELPAYLYPWVGVAMAACAWAWRARGHTATDARAVRERFARRFAIAAAVPPLVLLSVAATARGIYAAPALPGIALLCAGWCAPAARPTTAERRALRSAIVLVALLGVALVVAWCLFSPAGSESMRTVTRALFVGVGGAFAALALGAAWSESADGAPGRVVAMTGLALCAVLAGPGFAAVRAVDASQDFAQLGAAIQATAGDAPLVLWRADETTRAFVDLHVRRDVAAVADWQAAARHERVGDRLAARPGLFALMQLPGRAPGAVESHLPARWRPATPAAPAEIAGDPRVRTVREFEIPGGRRYALLTAATPR